MEIFKLGNIAYFGEFSKLGKKAPPKIGKKNNPFRRYVSVPGPTSAGFFEVVFKDEGGIGQLFMRRQNRAI